MDIRQLETFVQVARYQSFSKAAEHLFITQPTVTNHVQSLEQELNTLLVSRMGKRIDLTNEGRVLYEYAISVLNLLDQARYDLLSNKEDIKGELTLYASSVPRKILLPKIIADFHKEHKNITFTVREKDTGSVAKDISQGRADYGFLGKKIADPNLEMIELIEDEVVVVVNNDYPKENGHEIKKEDLLDFSWIYREEGSGTQSLVDFTLEQHGVPANKMKVIARFEDLDMIKNSISHGFGSAFLSKYVIRQEVENNTLKYLKVKDMELKRLFYFAYHKYRKLSPVNNLFCDFMIKNYAKK